MIDESALDLTVDDATDDHAELHAALHATLDAALDELAAGFDALCVLDAEGVDVSEAAERLAGVADRVAALAGGLDAVGDDAGEDEADDEVILHAAADALADALDGLEAAIEGLDPAHGAAAEALAVAADRVAAAAVITAGAARELEVWGFDLDAHAPPAAFASPVLRAAAASEAVGREHIATMALDAQTAFVEWSITPDGLARARGALLAEDPPVLTLRVYLEGDGQPAESVDHPVDRWVGQRRLVVARPGAMLVCALGLAAGGTFAHIARAVAVQMPTVGPDRHAVRFTRVRVDEAGKRHIEEVAAPAISEIAPSQATEPAEAATKRPFFALDRAFLPPTAEVIR